MQCVENYIERLAAVIENGTQIRLYKKDDILFCVPPLPEKHSALKEKMTQFLPVKDFKSLLVTK